MGMYAASPSLPISPRLPERPMLSRSSSARSLRSPVLSPARPPPNAEVRQQPRTSAPPPQVAMTRRGSANALLRSSSSDGLPVTNANFWSPNTGARLTGQGLLRQQPKSHHQGQREVEATV